MKNKIIIGSICAVPIVVIGIVLAIKLPALLSNNDVKESTVGDNSVVVLDNPVADKEAEEPTVQLETPDKVIKPTNYVDFVYDATESREDYMKSKVSIQGSGTVIINKGNSGASGSNGQSGGSAPDNTQEFWYTASENKSNYLYVVDDYNYSNGFGAVLSVKYDINVESAAGSVAIFNAPNNTKLLVTELDPNTGDATYWHQRELEYNGFGKWSISVEPDVLGHNSKYIYGVGVKDWDMQVGYSTEDLTVSTNGNQLICDITMDTLFGEGYYFEVVDTETAMFTGHLIIQHGDRVYYCKATSEYQETIKDIATACLDRCITVY